MTNNVKHTYDSEHVEAFIALIDRGDYKEAEKQLNMYCRSLFWCFCGATYLKTDELPHIRANEVHREGCHEHYCAPSAVIFLEIAIARKDTELIAMIREKTLRKQWWLTPRQLSMVLTEVCSSNHREVVRHFNWEWLMGLQRRGYVLKEYDVMDYAAYVWRVLKAMVSNTKDPSPALNKLMLPMFVTILLPPYSNYDAYVLFTEAINKTRLGDLFLKDDALSTVRETMVTEYGILWRANDLSATSNSIKIRSVIRFVLDTYVGYFRTEHARWFQTLNGVFAVYLNQYVLKLRELIRLGDDSWIEKQSKLWSLGRYVHSESAKRTFWQHITDAIYFCPCVVVKAEKPERLLEEEPGEDGQEYTF